MAGSSNGMVILDDRNPEIVYSTGWGFDWDPLAAYNSTFHLAGAQGLSASLTYVGTQVIVKGCVGTAPDHVAGQVLATYSVDGKSYGSTNVDDLTFCNATLFASPTLPHGQHRLEVTTNNIAPNELWIDSFSIASATLNGYKRCGTFDSHGYGWRFPGFYSYGQRFTESYGDDWESPESHGCGGGNPRYYDYEWGNPGSCDQYRSRLLYQWIDPSS
ncbi:hypothetical protein C8Q73DRAFT_665257 [Cubamyces lactineus]|nr:hypothetical protein C8Q73DRAFT_665257 [Cubamyces lactineus]